MLKYRPLTEKDEKAYDSLVMARADTLFYHSLQFRDLLRRFVGEDCYILAFWGKTAVGAMPSFILKSSYGNVINSLPFWGSNGGIVIRPDLSSDEKRKIKEGILKYFYYTADKLECITSTIITSPLEKDPGFYDEVCKPDYLDSRIGQITVLPDDPKPDGLLSKFEPVRRRNIYKAMKSGVTHYDSNSKVDIDFLHRIHVENISAIGGLTKPLKFFKAVRNFLKYGRDYRIYVAEKEGQRIASLLSFYFNRTVEYYVPCVVEKYRSYQPLSLLIFEAMQDATREGYKYWNWGGTWHTQKGVYDFKKRWGTEDIEYKYYIKVHNKSFNVKVLDRTRILRSFPYFYVMPFHLLESNR